MSRFFTLTTLAFCAAMTCIPADAENTLQQIGQVKPSHMSPDGGYVVGFRQEYTEPLYDVNTHKGFVWTPAEGLKWLTEWDGSSTDNTGVFLYVNKAGMLAGAVKDPAMRLPAGGGGDFAPPIKRVKRAAEDEQEGLPIFKAALWRDGKLYELEGGRGNISEYSDETDGSYASVVSADGSVVVGYNQLAGYPSGLMRWTYDQASDSYKFENITVPEGAIGCSVIGISDFGDQVYANVIMPGQYGAINHPAVWTAETGWSMVQIPDIESYNYDFGAVAMSPDNAQMLICGNSAESHFLGVYDVLSESLERIELPAGIFSVKAQAITDDGNIFLSLTDSSWTASNYYLNRGDNTFLTLADYLSECAAGVDGIAGLAEKEVLAVSGDGKHLLLYQDNWPAGTSHMLSLDNPAVSMAAAPENLRIFHSSPEELTCTWSGIKNIPEGISVMGYSVTVDNMEPVFVEGTAGNDYSAKIAAKIGTKHNAIVRTVYLKNGIERTSGDSAAASVYLPSETSLTSYDNFDDCILDSNGNPIYTGEDWQTVVTESNSQVIQWYIDVRDYENNNPYANVISIADTPWSCAWTSRYHDAGNADHFFLSFYLQSKEVNEAGQDRSTDFLDVDYSIDGSNWETLASICAADVRHAVWNFYQLPLSEKLAGKIFQLRFNAHGQGKAQIAWAVDCIGISDKMEAEAPQGVRISEYTDGRPTITWQNTMKAWDASYVVNSSIEFDKNAASEGKPVMMAVDLSPEKLKAHVGEYISGVSAFLYDDPSIIKTDSKIEAIVFADNMEVARASFAAPFDIVRSSTAWLDHPVLIKEGVTYRVAVNLAKYDAGNAPLYYQSAPDSFKPGVTDLFSEDGGVTWQTMSDALPGSACIWSIHADITATPEDVAELQKDTEIIGYNVYRDGVKINNGVIYSPYMRFIDEAPVEKASYTVQAFYRDGRVSEISAPCEFNAATLSVGGIQEDTASFTVSPDAILLNGDFTGARLYDVSGKIIAIADGSSIDTTSLPTGVYLLRINVADRIYVHKIIVR